MVASGVSRQHFQMTSPLKLLGQLQLNFIYNLQVKGQRKVIGPGLGHMTKMTVMPI